MDPHGHPLDEGNPSGSAGATATHNAENPRRINTQGFGPRVPASIRTAVSSIGKDAIAATPVEYSTVDDVMVRGSWVSFTSTAASRESVTASLFSRNSVASASTRYSARQSSIESPISVTSPMYLEHRKSSFPGPPRYHCTFCDEAFDTLTEWKLHEYDSHDRPESYACRDCPATFPRAALLTDHLRTSHGPGPALPRDISVRYGPIRGFWSCGFCGAVTAARSDYLAHVGNHYDEGKVRSEWQHTRVIEGLLHQPGLESAWIALVAKEEAAQGAKLRFLWDPSTSGRSTDPMEPHLLQDMLEFFATGTRMADEVARAAYSSAHIRPERDVRELTSKLYPRDPKPKLARPTPNPAQPSPDLQPTAFREEDDVISPIAPLPASLPFLAAPLRSSDRDPSPSDSDSRAIHAVAGNAALSDKVLASLCEGLSRVSSPLGSVSQEAVSPFPPRPIKPTGLRRIESSRSLAPSNETGSAQDPLDRPTVGSLPRAPSFGAPPTPIRRTADTQPRVWTLPRDLGMFDAHLWSIRKPADIQPRLLDARFLETPRAVNMGFPRPHTSSSTLSTPAGEGSQGFGDSTSDVTSDDTISEPDAGLEVDSIPRASKVWKDAFQRRIDQGMGRLWARYKHDWDALVTQCGGDRSGGSSTQSRNTSGRVQKAAHSRQPQGKGLRPNRQEEADEDEDNDDDGAHPPPASKSRGSSKSAKHFACPYRKHDPHTYNLRDHQVCAIHAWDMSRLKEHLYRRHYKTHCQRCKQTFKDADALRVHEMSVVSCEVLDIAPPCEISTYQERLLKSKKHTSRKQSDEEKWRDIYRILFPNEDIPTPYPEVGEDTAPMISGESVASLAFQHFLLAEMPGLFAQTAAEHAGRPLRADDGLRMEAIPRIIEEALRKGFDRWKAGGSELLIQDAAHVSNAFMPPTPTSLVNSVGTGYHTPQPPVPTVSHTLPGYPSSTGFVSDTLQPTVGNYPGFYEDNLVPCAPPVHFPQYDRSSPNGWPGEPDFNLTGTGQFETGWGMFPEN